MALLKHKLPLTPRQWLLLRLSICYAPTPCVFHNCRRHFTTMDLYPCANRYKHGVDCPVWVYVHNARCEDCVVYNR
ncbi:hypothetical protein CDEST_15599 [Colletotrichum destructivum]|uniref:Secreted protein n=1 Tax=Colletotrichum destructivum TaxID=34406 RepID=A0AAX4J595_9PEZI|nr:hypothetical protein CDEST_15599 [Colletotrichum destructivum]